MHFKSNSLLFICLFLISAIIFLIHYSVVGQAVYGDGIYYYSYTHSWYKDHDLNMRNEYGHHYNHTNNNSAKEEPLGLVGKPTETGYLPNKYPIGPSVSWLPGFFVGDLIANIAKLVNKDVSTLGYSDYYQISVGLWNIVLITLGLFFLYRFLLEIFREKIALVTILTIFFGTNLIYYGSWDVVNSHPFSFFIASFFIFFWWKTQEKRNSKDWLMIGILSGLLTITRTQDILFLIIPFLDLIFRTKTTIKMRVVYGIVTFGGFLLTIFPQLYIWKLFYGSYFISPYIHSKEGFDLIHPHIWGVLTNTKTGILIYTPLLFISYVGLHYVKTKSLQRLKYYSLLLITLQFFLITTWSGWTQGESFGVRMLISTFPFLAVGTGTILTLLVKKSKWYWLTPLFFIGFTSLAIIYFLAIVHGPTYDLSTNTKIGIFKKLHIPIYK